MTTPPISAIYPPASRLAVRRRGARAAGSPGDALPLKSRLTRMPAVFFAVVAILLFTSLASAAPWLEGYTHRRPVNVKWDNDTTHDQLAIADFFTGGQAQADGADIRVATDDGKAVATHVLQFGPGDHVSVVFPLIKDVAHYYVYFGNPAAPPPEPKMRTGPEQVVFDAGMLLEMRIWNGGFLRNSDEIKRAWDNGGAMLGQTMIEQPFYGLNPFGPQEQTVAKLTGSLVVPDDGNYIISAWADDFGSIWLDGKAILRVRVGPADTRVRTTINLKKGPHEFILYNVNTGGPLGWSVVWQKPNTGNFELIPKSAFGQFHRAEVGSLEEIHKVLTADFTAENLSECFFADAYSHRYQFTAKAAASDAATYEWDFGDGQSATGMSIRHVYVLEGEYPVKLTVRIGGNSDSLTNKLVVTRDWVHLDQPAQDDLNGESQAVAAYHVDTMPPDALARVCWLHEHAGAVEPALAAAARLATLPTHRDPDSAMLALQAVTRLALANGKADDVEKFWRSVPDASNIQPRAKEQLAQLLLWRSADFDAAVHLLAPYTANGEDKVRRLYGEALVLDQKSEEGGKLLKSLRAAVIGDRAPAVSGAHARTIEFYIRDGDWESAQDAWEEWQQQFPADFLGGYSVLLQSKLMELKNAPAAAAKVAEAFALAEPTSSYAPQLLDRASKLLAKTDPAKSDALHKMLKEKYPEDPLSQ